MSRRRKVLHSINHPFFSRSVDDFSHSTEVTSSQEPSSTFASYISEFIPPSSASTSASASAALVETSTGDSTDESAAQATLETSAEESVQEDGSSTVGAASEAEASGVSSGVGGAESGDAASAASPVAALRSRWIPAHLQRSSMRNSLDIHSCIHFLLELYSQWLIPPSGEKKIPIAFLK